MHQPLHLGDVFCYIQHMYFKCIMFYAYVLCKYIIPSNISFMHLMKLWYHYESWFTCFMHNVLNMFPMYHFCFTCFLHHVSHTMYVFCIIYIGPILSLFLYHNYLTHFLVIYFAKIHLVFFQICVSRICYSNMNYGLCLMWHSYCVMKHLFNNLWYTAQDKNAIEKFVHTWVPCFMA